MFHRIGTGEESQDQSKGEVDDEHEGGCVDRPKDLHCIVLLWLGCWVGGVGYIGVGCVQGGDVGSSGPAFSGVEPVCPFTSCEQVFQPDNVEPCLHGVGVDVDGR